MKHISEVMHEFLPRFSVDVPWLIENKWPLVGRHNHPEGFFPSQDFFFWPQKMLGSEMVKGRTMWMNGEVLENDFWVIPGNIQWREATRDDINQLMYIRSRYLQNKKP
jgi:hypothetical protein